MFNTEGQPFYPLLSAEYAVGHNSIIENGKWAMKGETYIGIAGFLS